MSYFLRWLCSCIIIGVASPSIMALEGFESEGQMLRVWASAAPDSYLAGARIRITDSRGNVVGVGKTTERGTASIKLNRKAGKNLPLRVVSSGGFEAGKPFTGHLSAYANQVGLSADIVHLDLISTIAYRITNKGNSYADSVKKVRDSLGIRKGAPVDVLRVMNHHVDYGRLKNKIAERKGHSRLVGELARLVKRGENVDWFRPKKDQFDRELIDGALVSSESTVKAAADSASQSPVCTTPVGTSLSNGPSTKNIANYGNIAFSTLLVVIGYPATTNGIITGMIFGPLGASQTSPDAQAINNVQSELSCIAQQINYLQEEVAELTFQVDLAGANSCNASVQSGWRNYQFAINNASAEPLNSSNPSLLSFLSQWNQLNTICGSAINNSLFGTAGGQAGAWQQLNANYQSPGSGGYYWYTQAEVQQLQIFLSYWSTVLYEQSVLTNEYNNFYNLMEAARAAAGGGASASNQGGAGSSACEYGTVGSTATYCAWQANIANAYPPDLFSDEIGVYSSGIGVIGYPAGLGFFPYGSSSPSSGQLGLNTNSMASLLLSSTSYGNVFAPGPVLNNLFTQFNSLGINPKGYGDAVETFTNPQALRTVIPSSGQMQGLTSNNPGGQSAATYLLGQINKDSTSTWTGLSSSQVGFWASDSASHMSILQNTLQQQMGQYSFKFSPGSFIGNYSSQYPVCSKYFGVENVPYPNACGTNPTSPPPVMGGLLGRTWWTGALSAKSYAPPTPPSVPLPPTLTAVSGGDKLGTLQVAFNAPSSAGFGPAGVSASINGYLATCSDVSGAIYTATGSVSPVTVTGLSPGVTYSCYVQAMNSGGYSNMSNTVSGETLDIILPGAPILISGQYTAPLFTFTLSPPSELGSPALNQYKFSCIGDIPNLGPWSQTFSVSPSSTVTWYMQDGGNGTVWTCSAQSVSSAGISAPSNSIKFTGKP